MRTLTLLAFLLAIPLTGRGAPVDAGKPVDIVICLDTSGSMDGLIDSAKRKLWTVVNDLAKVEPTPALRVALYSYGNNTYDARKGWVRKETNLTTDLDSVYKQLNALRTAAPGSDEFVARVTRDALTDMRWTDDQAALRLIFVCGNEPVDQDKEVTLELVAALAKKRGVLINTIYCGPQNHAEYEGWRKFAVSCGGKAASIDQNRAGVEVAVATPFDEALVKLSTRINSTYVCYGAKGEAGAVNQKAQDENAAKSAGGVAADRASTKGGRLYRNAEWDLVDRMLTDKTFDFKTLKEDDLPDELRKTKPAERLAFLQKKAAERAAIQKEVAELSGKRALFIEKEQKKQPKSTADQAFDEAVRGILRDQAAAKGMKIKE